MRKLIFLSISALVSALIVWACLGFMAWQWHPEMWDPSGRGLGVFAWALLTYVGTWYEKPRRRRY